jgi:nicotinamidase/pyrazinamidase
MNLHPGDALLLVDIQNDFLPGGSLAVPQGNQVVPVANRYLTLFQTYHLPVFATRDWHPPLHCSFQSQGGPWPPHCVAGTAGAGFPTGLHLSADTRIVSKATTPERDAYSGFSGTELDRLLKEAEIRRLFVVGLATDYCVLNTVKDALALGYSVCLLTDAIRAVENHRGDGERAIAEMRGLGAVLLDFQALQE